MQLQSSIENFIKLKEKLKSYRESLNLLQRENKPKDKQKDIELKYPKKDKNKGFEI